MIDYEERFVERLIRLRQQKGVSARDMSLSLGQSESYINKIESRKALPSMAVFFYICEYFDITPKEFFNDELVAPAAMQDFFREGSRLSSEQLAHLTAIARDMKKTR